MSEHLPHNSAPDEDIQQALEQVHHTGEMQDGSSAQSSKILQLTAAVPIPMPVTTNRIILAIWLARNLWWGFCSAGSKLLSYAKEHPWKAVGGLAVSGGCGLLCGYFGSLMLMGGMFYALKKKS